MLANLRSRRLEEEKTEPDSKKRKKVRMKNKENEKKSPRSNDSKHTWKDLSSSLKLAICVNSAKI
jgi:hypothetical protein